MPLLAYCIAEAGPEIEIPREGLQNAIIRTVSECGLISFVSDYQPQGDRNHLRGAVLDFNRVLQALLQHVAIIPFRFPTVVADESDMSNLLRDHAAQYRESLMRLRDVVQLELNLTFAGPIPTSNGSGTQYLRARQTGHHLLADSAQNVRLALTAWIQDWRQHESSKGMRCYLLVPRASVTTVLERLKQTTIASALRARVTGPWPATEFLSTTEAAPNQG